MAWKYGAGGTGVLPHPAQQSQSQAPCGTFKWGPEYGLQVPVKEVNSLALSFTTSSSAPMMEYTEWKENHAFSKLTCFQG